MNSEEQAGPSADATLVSVPNAKVATFSLNELGLAPVSGPVIAENSRGPAVCNPEQNQIENKACTVENVPITELVDNSTQTDEGEWFPLPNVQTTPLDLSLNPVSAQNPGISSAAVVVPVGNSAKKGEKFKPEETIALLKSVAWMGFLRQEYENLSVDKMCREIAGNTFWIENYKGKGSLLQRFYMAVGNQGKNRSLDSLKRKWKGEVSDIAKNPKKYFEKYTGISDAEQKFLEHLVHEYCK